MAFFNHSANILGHCVDWKSKAHTREGALLQGDAGVRVRTFVDYINGFGRDFVYICLDLAGMLYTYVCICSILQHIHIYIYIICMYSICFIICYILYCISSYHVASYLKKYIYSICHD